MNNKESWILISETKNFKAFRANRKFTVPLIIDVLTLCEDMKKQGYTPFSNRNDFTTILFMKEVKQNVI